MAESLHILLGTSACLQWLYHSGERTVARGPLVTRAIALWQVFNSKSCLCNSSCSFQWILVKPSSYCCHDLKRIILYQGHA